MELEHVMQQSGWFIIMQMLMGSLLVPAMIGRVDLYRSFVRSAASNIVSFGPFGLLVYILFEVSFGYAANDCGLGTLKSCLKLLAPAF